VGRVDSRFLGDAVNLLGESAFYDPMTTAIGPPFLASFMDYYRADLGVETSDEYVISGKLWMSWDWQHAQPDLEGYKVPFPNTLVDLSMTMKLNPSMKVLYQQGYYDLATPFQGALYYIDQMEITPVLRQNVTIELYDAGHMMYLHEPSLIRFKQDLARFIQGALREN
jgi:carboxypeptidase C (cathepsin A)